MTITAEQIQTRNKFLGASDVPAVLGLNPYRTPADVWLEKTADILPSDDTEAIEIGNDFERPMLAWAERKIGKPLDVDCDTVFSAGGLVCCHPDAVIRGESTPVEAKCSAKTDEWGDEGSDDVPEMYLVQLHAQMLCLDADVGMLAAFLGGFRMSRRLYRIPRNDDLCKAIDEQCREWWDKHVVGGVMPDSAPSLATVRRIAPRPGVVVPIDASVIEEYHAAKEKKKAAETAEKEARARLEAVLAGADAGDCDGWVCEFKNVPVKEYVVPARVDRRLTVKLAK